MCISKKISSIIVAIALLAGSSGLNAVSGQDKKKAAERKLKRTTKEATKGKAKPKGKGVVSVKQPLAVKRTIAAKKPVSAKRSVAAKKPVTKGYQTMPPVEPAPMNVPYDKPLPAIPVVTADMPPSDMPTDLPVTLSVALIDMLPSNLQNRVANMIALYRADSQNMFKNIYLLAWVDDELMKKFNSPDFYSVLITVISQECNVPYAVIETMAASVKDQIDTTLTNFENAIVAGDKSKVNVQQVRDVFRNEDSYPEYLERCLRLANEYKQPAIATLLKMAILTASKTTYTPKEEEIW